MDNDSKLRPLYLAKILYEQTDEEHYLTTVQLINMLEEKYGIKAHRQTIKSEIELLRKFGFQPGDITKGRQNGLGTVAVGQEEFTCIHRMIHKFTSVFVLFYHRE